MTRGESATRDRGSDFFGAIKSEKIYCAPEHSDHGRKSPEVGGRLGQKVKARLSPKLRTPKQGAQVFKVHVV